MYAVKNARYSITGCIEIGLFYKYKYSYSSKHICPGLAYMIFVLAGLKMETVPQRKHVVCFLANN